MRKILVLAGTRPEVIKVAAVLRELHRRNDIETCFCSTGQHREMLAQALEAFGLTTDRDLDIMQANQSLGQLTSMLFTRMDTLLEQEHPDWVFVQGDTTSVMVTALCAFYRQIKVGHIEAGLRSYNRFAPFPEEVNRRVVSVTADLHFAPTEQARQALLREGVADSDVVVTGNTVIDALQWVRDEVAGDVGLLPEAVRDALAAGQRIILVTGHRRESLGQGMNNICQALRRIADQRPDLFLVYPVHLNPHVRETVMPLLSGHPRIALLEPMAYRPFVALLNVCYLALTDSGGIQEEAPALNKPVLVMRNTTERPEGVEAGAARLVGTSVDGIVNGVALLLDDATVYAGMAQAPNPYGDGKAAKRIVGAVCAR
ncbi:MAG: UDP-N-acetylglucosamine 2-epimerase (non-hydrolyzing) [Acidobacteria bacterium]|nr:MAG: UDP-N-acetylglucosamine 2-epimerase (non-hydrolyzing) [Acidobacteriota bacterium]